MAQELQPGEHVSWSYGTGQAKGLVVEKLTENKKLGSRVFKASPDEPKYLVKSDTSGKEAIKKPETLHKIDEDAGGADNSSESSEGAPKESMHTSTESDASRQEVGAKEKRDGLKQRSSEEETKEADHEESAKKVVDTGEGSIRASAKAAKGKLKQVAEVQEESGGQKHKAYKPKEDTVDEDDEEPVVVGKEAKEEGIKEVADEGRMAVGEPPKAD